LWAEGRIVHRPDRLETVGVVDRNLVAELVGVLVLSPEPKTGEVLGHGLQETVALRLGDDAGDVAVNGDAALVVDFQVVFPVLPVMDLLLGHGGAVEGGIVNSDDGAGVAD